MGHGALGRGWEFLDAHFAYTKFSIGKVYKTTEYMIVLLGASLFQTGVTNFFVTHFTFSLSNFGSFHLSFLPNEDSFIGTLLQSFLGIDSSFSLARLALMMLYIGIMYIIVFNKNNILLKTMKGK